MACCLDASLAAFIDMDVSNAASAAAAAADGGAAGAAGAAESPVPASASPAASVAGSPGPAPAAAAKSPPPQLHILTSMAAPATPSSTPTTSVAPNATPETLGGIMRQSNASSAYDMEAIVRAAHLSAAAAAAASGSSPCLPLQQHHHHHHNGNHHQAMSPWHQQLPSPSCCSSPAQSYCSSHHLPPFHLQQQPLHCGCTHTCSSAATTGSASNGNAVSTEQQLAAASASMSPQVHGHGCCSSGAFGHHHSHHHPHLHGHHNPSSAAGSPLPMNPFSSYFSPPSAPPTLGGFSRSSFFDDLDAYTTTGPHTAAVSEFGGIDFGLSPAAVEMEAVALSDVSGNKNGKSGITAQDDWSLSGTTTTVTVKTEEGRESQRRGSIHGKKSSSFFNAAEDSVTDGLNGLHMYDYHQGSLLMDEDTPTELDQNADAEREFEVEGSIASGPGSPSGASNYSDDLDMEDYYPPQHTSFERLKSASESDRRAFKLKRRNSDPFPSHLPSPPQPGSTSSATAKGGSATATRRFSNASIMSTSSAMSANHSPKHHGGVRKNSFSHPASSSSASSAFSLATASGVPGSQRRRASICSTSSSASATIGAAAGKKVYNCPFDGCGRTFPRQYNLKSHIYCHTGERPHICEDCGSAFARKHDLQRHMRTLHANDRPYRCKKCNQGFTRADQLVRHQAMEEKGLSNVVIEEAERRSLLLADVGPLSPLPSPVGSAMRR